jgi:hypothetical protein
MCAYTSDISIFPLGDRDLEHTSFSDKRAREHNITCERVQKIFNRYDAAIKLIDILWKHIPQDAQKSLQKRRDGLPKYEEVKQAWRDASKDVSKEAFGSKFRTERDIAEHSLRTIVGLPEDLLTDMLEHIDQGEFEYERKSILPLLRAAKRAKEWLTANCRPDTLQYSDGFGNTIASLIRRDGGAETSYAASVKEFATLYDHYEGNFIPQELRDMPQPSALEQLSRPSEDRHKRIKALFTRFARVKAWMDVFLPQGPVLTLYKEFSTQSEGFKETIVESLQKQTMITRLTNPSKFESSATSIERSANELCTFVEKLEGLALEALPLTGRHQDKVYSLLKPLRDQSYQIEQWFKTHDTTDQAAMPLSKLPEPDYKHAYTLLQNEILYAITHSDNKLTHAFCERLYNDFYALYERSFIEREFTMVLKRPALELFLRLLDSNDTSFVTRSLRARACIGLQIRSLPPDLSQREELRERYCDLNQRFNTAIGNFLNDNCANDQAQHDLLEITKGYTQLAIDSVRHVGGDVGKRLYQLINPRVSNAIEIYDWLQENNDQYHRRNDSEPLREHFIQNYEKAYDAFMASIILAIRSLGRGTTLKPVDEHFKQLKMFSRRLDPASDPLPLYKPTSNTDTILDPGPVPPYPNPQEQ